MTDVAAGLTAAWLTETLFAHGHLAQGEVVSLDLHTAVEYAHSWHVYVGVTYSSQAPPLAPDRLVIKRTKPHARKAANREAHFYASIAPHLSGIPLAPYFGTGTAADKPYLLLADLSSTHTILPGSPSRSHVEAMVALLTQLHSSSWDNIDLVPLLDRSPEQTLDAMFEGADQNYAELVKTLEPYLTAQHRHVLERYVSAAPALFSDRLRRGTALTLCHPDNIPSNFLFPLRSGPPICLIDWHVYRFWWGPVDIAALIMRSAPAELQAQGEQLVRAYHVRLQALGVMDYTWDACWYDYRLGLIDTLRVVLAQRANPMAALQTMMTLTDALHRHDCLELLNRPPRELA